MSAILNTQIPRRTVSILLAGLFVMGLFILPAQAQSPEQQVRTMLEKRDREIKQAVKPLIDNPDGATQAQRDHASSLINDQIDFEEMGRLALGKYWADLTDKQRTDFVDVFSTIVRSQSLADLTAYNATVAYDEINVNGDKAHVKTTARIEDKKLKVEYLMGLKDGAWWLYDIILDEVGTVDGYAVSFQSYIRKRGFDKFMASLHKKRDKIQTRS